MIGHTEANITFGQVVTHMLTWLLIIIFTLGIGLMFYPYAFAKFIINRTVIYQDGRRYRLQCQLGVGGQLWHIILWTFLVIFTAGIAYFFYVFKVWNVCLNNTTLQS